MIVHADTPINNTLLKNKRKTLISYNFLFLLINFHKFT